MKRTNKLLTLLVMVALLVSACQPIQSPALQSAPAAPATEPHGLRTDAPSYAVHGPYTVGVGNFEIDATKENERPLTVTVWYPALNPQGAKESVTYEMGFPAGETPNVSIFGHAVENAEPSIDGAPYPLIVHSHGHWSFRQESAYLDEHLASMGFVVISADHEDNWSTLFGPKAWQSEFRRPNEVTREIDYAEKLGADGGALAGIVDTGRVGVFGWSYGGETALIAGGARLDLGKLRAWCVENTVDGDFPDTDCVDILDHESELATLSGLNETPQGLWPDWSDKRVDAVIGLAPWVGSLSESSLQTLNVPTLLMIGSADSAAGPTYRPFQPYQKIAAERKAEVVFENADHFLFFSACKDVPDLVPLGLEVFCSDPLWDMDRSHDLINHFVTAFLLAELKGDTDAAKALAPENVTFPGIQYETTGFGANAAVPIQSESGFAEVNGTRLYYEMAGAGEPIVMIHGLGWDTRDWDAQFAEFAKQYQVVRYDMRGFGKSDMPTDQPYSHADDLKALLDYLGAEPAHLFGHSFGGEIAINFALTYPKATRSLVLIEPDIQGAQGLPALTSEEEASFTAVFAALEKGDRVGAALAIVDIHPLITVSKDVPGVRELILSTFTDYQWFQFLNEDPVVQPEIPSAERIGEITAPTLLVVGDSTTEFQKIEVDRLAEQLPNAEKVVFENSDHFPHLLYPEKFNALVFDFLAKLASQPR